MVLSTKQCLEMQTGIKDKMQDKPYTLRSISHQREVLYLYKVNFRSTSPRLDYSLEGGLISLSDGPYSQKVIADEISATLNSQLLQSRKLTFFIFIIYIIKLLFYLKE